MHSHVGTVPNQAWIPAYAGMTQFIEQSLKLPSSVAWRHLLPLGAKGKTKELQLYSNPTQIV